MKKLPIFLILLFLGNCGGKGKTAYTVKSEYTTCHSCVKYGVDVEALAQVNVRARYRSSLTRGPHTYPGCQGVKKQFVCFVSGKNLFCGSKRALGVFVTDSTYNCNNYKVNAESAFTK